MKKDDMLSLEKQLTDNMKDIEKQFTDDMNDAKIEEQKNAYHIQNELIEEREKLRKQIPYPEVHPYDTESDYELGRWLRDQKESNKPFEKKVDEISKYCDNEALYKGHICLESGNEFYVMGSQLSPRTVEEKENCEVKLFYEDDKDYQEFFRMWRYPDEYMYSLRYSRDITLRNWNVENVVVLFDKRGGVLKYVSDQFLRKALISNKDKSGIFSIILTIQKNQNNIRTWPSNESFIVQGCAGSGKSTVLLHRLRYLLFNNMIGLDDYVYLIPSTRFKDYVNNALHEFRISPNYTTPYQTYYKELCGAKKDSANEDADEIVLSAEYLKRVYSEKFIQDCYNEFFGFIFNQADKLISICTKKLKDLIDSESSPIDKEITILSHMIECLMNIKQQREDIVNSLAPSKDQLVKLLKEGNAVLNVFSKHFSQMEKIDLKKECGLFEDDTDIKRFSSLRNILFRRCRTKFKAEFGKNISSAYKHYWYLRLYCRYLTCGFDKKLPSYLFLDEAQDLSVSEICLLKKVHTETGKSGKLPVMNVFGDINQMITKHGIKDWSSLAFVSPTVFELKENFRNTSQVVKYCNAMLPYTLTDVGVERDEVSCYTAIDDLLKNNHWIFDSAVAIVKDDCALADFQRLMKDQKITNATVYTVKQVKGLEFKETVVFDQNMTDNEKYIAYTRTLDKMNVVSELPRVTDWQYQYMQGEDEEEI